MDYRLLGRTGLRVSPLCLGTMNFGMRGEAGVQTEEDEAHRIMDRGLDLGINFLDTARAYGESEAIIGRTLRTRRQDFFLCSKVLSYQNENLNASELKQRVTASVHESLRALQEELRVTGEITIWMVLQAPGVLRFSEDDLLPNETWPTLEAALKNALDELVRMRQQEGKHLAKDLIHRLKVVRQSLKEVRRLHPAVAEKYRVGLLDRLEKAGLEFTPGDDRLLKEVALFADRSDISEELTRLESHPAQFAHHLRKNEPVGRTLEFITQEIARELNTLGAKANDAQISRHVVACKAELEKIREQVQNLE